MNEERRIDRYEKVPYTEAEFSEIYGPNNEEWLSAAPYTGVEDNDINELPRENTTEMPSFSVGDKLSGDIGLYLIRKKRNSLINESDFRVLPDYPIDENKRLEWQIYRQQLRDITENVDINNIIPTISSGTLTFSSTDGSSLPNDLTLNPATGYISGAPTVSILDSSVIYLENTSLSIKL